MEGISNAEAAEHKIGGPQHIDTIRQKQSDGDTTNSTSNNNGSKSEKGGNNEHHKIKPESSSPASGPQVTMVTDRKEMAVDSALSTTSVDEQTHHHHDHHHDHQPLQPALSLTTSDHHHHHHRHHGRYTPPSDMPADVENRLSPPSPSRSPPMVAMVSPSPLPAPLLPMQHHHNGCMVSSPESSPRGDTTTSASNHGIDNIMDVSGGGIQTAPLCTSLLPSAPTPPPVCENSSLIESPSEERHHQHPMSHSDI